jgi:hypothetical protein
VRVGWARSTETMLDHVWPRIRGRLDGITDDEYLWEPVPGCWSVRQVDGSWEIERVIPPPSPPPVTTIAWRTWHIGIECLDGFSQRAFQVHALDLNPLEWYPRADDALAAMDAAWRCFSTCYRALDDKGMARALGPSFGSWAESNVADLLLHIADEIIHHGAEIALMRDLFTASAGRALK